MAISGKLKYTLILLITIVSVVIIGVSKKRSVPIDETIEFSGPHFDKTTGDMTLVLRIKPGVAEVHDAQNAITRALDILAQEENDTNRKVLKIGPGRYVFSRPVIFRSHHLGIDLVGEPERTRPLTGRRINAGAIRDEIAKIQPGLPTIDGNGVSSFLMIDGVTEGIHLSTVVTGFYFLNQMAGLGGTHYPDFSYRLDDDGFTEKGGYYTRYAYNDGGVVSVLGNSSITFEHNIVDHPSAFQCGGVLRNEQYGAPGSTRASVIRDNIIINPFAWHTGAFVDNNTGSYVQVLNNQILLDDDLPHEVGMITNFDDAFLVAENNHIIDVRADKTVPSIGIRLLGRQGGVVTNGNIFEGVSKHQVHLPDGSPPFPEYRRLYFLVRKGKIWKLVKSAIPSGKPQLIKPGEWPEEMDVLVRTKDLEDDDRLRIASLKIHFNQVRSDLRRRPRG